MTFTEAVVAAGIALSIALMVLALPFGIAILFFTLALAVVSYKRGVITVDPPTFARTTVWDALWPFVIKPRVVFLAEFFPFWEKLILVDKTPIVRAEGNQLRFTNVRCKLESEAETATSAETPFGNKETKQSGGSVEVHIGIAFFADESRSGEFIQAGRSTQVEKQLTTKIGTELRHQAAGKTWEEMALGKAAVSMELIIRLTGRQPTEKVSLDSGTGLPIPDPNFDPKNPARAHYKYRVEERAVGIPLIELNEWDIEHFINTALIDHPPDVHGLGIRLSQLGVTDVIPEGPLKDVADLKAREQQERRGEETDFDTEILLAQKYIDASKGDGGTPTITMEKALELVRINRRTSNVREVVIRGSTGPLTDAAALLGNNQTGGSQ